jgi:hypothetical protein
MYILQYNKSWVNEFHFFMQNLSHKSIYNLYKSCSTLHKETGKIGFTILWFVCEFLCNLQDSDTTQKNWRIFLQIEPWKRLNPHKNALVTKNLHTTALGGGGELAAGDVGPGQANKCHGAAIGLTRDRLAAVAWPETSPASGGGGAVAVRPRVLGFRRG